MEELAQDTTHKYRLHEKLRRDLGAPVLQALADPDTIEIILIADGTLWQECLGEKMRPIGIMEANRAEAVMRTIATCLDTTITRAHPLIEGDLPLDGSRFAGQIPPIVHAPTFAIRKRASAIFTLDDYVAQGIQRQFLNRFLQPAVLFLKLFQPSRLRYLRATIHSEGPLSISPESEPKCMPIELT